MDKWLLDILACPVCKGTLEYRRSANLFVCRFDRLGYEVRDGVPNFLEEEARQLSVEDVENGTRT